MKKFRQFSFGIVIIIAILLNVFASQRNEEPNQFLLLKNIEAIALASSESGEIYCSWGCYYEVFDVCLSCSDCGMYRMDWNENGGVGVCF